MKNMTRSPISTVQAARLKPGFDPGSVQEVSPTSNHGDSVIRGKALIFWDPETPGKKLSAIDTDQITPAAYCVSEDLDSLDQKWKEGAFKYLMPDFRERVHRGETFVVGGERFAIGSSREMSPAGLKAVAEEAGLTMVILCSHNMGDIFRRNAFNLGLEVVQSPEAVEVVQDGDELEFDPATRRIKNITQNKVFDPLPLTEKENEIRKSGGIFHVGRKEFKESVTIAPEIEWPDPATADKLTTTEQIIWAHRVNKKALVMPGATLRVYADLLPGSDGTAPFAIHTFNEITGGNAVYPRRAAVASDHFVFTGREADNKQTAIGRAFADKHEMHKPYFADPGDGIFHFYFPEQGLVMPGAFIPGADSHSRAYGAYGAVGVGIGSTTLGFGWSTGYIYFTPVKARKVNFVGTLQPWVSGKDIVLGLLQKWGSQQSQGMSVEFIDAQKQLPMAFRNTIANMMAEGEALNGIFAPDDITYQWYRDKGIEELPYPPLSPGKNARYAIEEDFDLSQVEPMIAKPESPANAHAAGEVAQERLTFNKAYIGSCTNGSYQDLLSAALIVRAGREKGVNKASTDFVIFPGSSGVKTMIEAADPRLGGESIADVFRSVGGQIRDSWCGPCFGQGPDALEPGQRAITSFNRNWQNRMGFGGEGFLASPAVVASSALLGYMAPPSELGLDWSPDRFGI